MKDSASRLTVLTTLGINAVKTYREVKGKPGKIETEGYGRAKTFTASQVEVDDRGRWLEKLKDKSESFVVLGAPKDWKKGERKRRLSSARDGAEATIIDVPRLWMPIDIDQVDFEPMGRIQDGEVFAFELLDRLGIRGMHCVWHLTNSHGFFGKYRARLWVQLTHPALAAEMKEWAKERWGDEKVEVEGKMKPIVDLSVYQSQQPIYTGDPILEGVESPVKQRVGFIEGDSLMMKLPKKGKAKKGAPEDENVERLQDAGLYIGRLKPGQHMIMCPWEETHSGEERDDDTFYFEPHHNGHDIPAFKCHHGSCEERKWVDVLEHMGHEATPDDDDEQRSPNWVYVHRLKAFWDARDGSMIDKESYNDTHGGKTKRGTPTERFFAMKRSEKTDAMEFLPGSERFVMRGRVRVLNSYIDMRQEPDEGNVTPWVEHLEWVIPDDRDRERLCDWMAWCYQHPGEKITWAPILYSKAFGIGKTTIFNCLATCLGRTHVSEPTQSELEDKFTDWCYGKLLVKIEELMSGDKFHVAEKLKPIVANPTISVRRMHQTGFSVENVANVCASTNHMQSLPLEKGDRRYMLIQCVEAEKEDRRPRMKAFWRWLKATGYGGIARWLSERDVSEFVPESEAPMTRLKQIVTEASKTDFDRAVDLCDVFDGVGIVSSAIIGEYLLANDCVIKGQRLGLIAAQRKWSTLKGREGRCLLGGKKIQFWTSDGNELALRAFLAKKPEERERAHANMAAKLVFDPEGARSKRSRSDV